MAALTDVDNWRLKTKGYIPFRVVSAEGEFREDSANFTLDLLIPSNELLRFAQEVYDPIYPIVYSRWYPPLHVTPDILQGLVLTSIKWKSFDDGLPVDPFGADTDASSKTYFHTVTARLTYEYFPYLIIAAEGSGEIYSVAAPTDKAKWRAKPGADLVDNADPYLKQTFVVPEVHWTLTYPRVDHDTLFGAGSTGGLIEELRPSQGHVNSGTFETLFNAPAETLLFMSYSTKRRTGWFKKNAADVANPPSSLEISIIQKHLERPYPDGTPLDPSVEVIGHNHTWRQGSGWERLLINEQPNYESVNFTELFDIPDREFPSNPADV